MLWVEEGWSFKVVELFIVSLHTGTDIDFQSKLGQNKAVNIENQAGWFWAFSALTSTVWKHTK